MSVLSAVERVQDFPIYFIHFITLQKQGRKKSGEKQGAMLKNNESSRTAE